MGLVDRHGRQSTPRLDDPIGIETIRIDGLQWVVERKVLPSGSNGWCRTPVPSLSLIDHHLLNHDPLNLHDSIPVVSIP
jgi:hypothetical protein